VISLYFTQLHGVGNSALLFIDIYPTHKTVPDMQKELGKYFTDE
jgi:hypothetical protein